MEPTRVVALEANLGHGVLHVFCFCFFFPMLVVVLDILAKVWTRLRELSVCVCARKDAIALAP